MLSVLANNSHFDAGIKLGSGLALLMHHIFKRCIVFLQCVTHIYIRAIYIIITMFLSRVAAENYIALRFSSFCCSMVRHLSARVVCHLSTKGNIVTLPHML